MMTELVIIKRVGFAARELHTSTFYSFNLHDNDATMLYKIEKDVPELPWKL